MNRRRLGRSGWILGLGLWLVLALGSAPFLAASHPVFDLDRDPLARQSFDTSELAHKKRLAFHYTFESLYERARGRPSQERLFRQKAAGLEASTLSEDVQLQRAKEDIRQALEHSYEATQLLGRLSADSWNASYEADVRQKFSKAEKGLTLFFGSLAERFSFSSKDPLALLRSALTSSKEDSRSFPHPSVKFERSSASLSKETFDAFVKIRSQPQNRTLVKLYDHGKKVSARTYEVANPDEGVEVPVLWPNFSATLLLEREGNVTLTAFKREAGSLAPCWGVQSDGAIVIGTHVFAETLGLQAPDIYNFSLLKCLRGHFLMSYFFNGGILHTGNEQGVLDPACYQDYLPFSKFLKQVKTQETFSKPLLRTGAVEDPGIMIHEGAVEFQNLTYEAQGLSDFRHLALDQSSLKNEGIVRVQGTLEGEKISLENHHLLLLNHMPKPLKDLTNKGNVFLYKSPTLHLRDLKNDGLIYGKSTRVLRSKKIPQSIGKFLTETDVEIQIDQLLDEAGLTHLGKTAWPLNPRQRVKWIFLTHTDHYENAIVDHYKIDPKTRARHFIRRMETGYQFKYRTTKKIEKIIEEETQAGNSRITSAALQAANKEASLSKLKKGLRDLLEKCKNTGLSKEALLRILRKKLGHGGVTGGDIETLLSDPFTQTFLDKITHEGGNNLASSPLLAVLDGGVAFQKWVQLQKQTYPNFTQVAGTFLKTIGHLGRGMTYLQGCVVGAGVLSESVVGIPVGCLGGMALVKASETVTGALFDQGRDTVGNILASQAPTPQKAVEYKALGQNLVDTAAVLGGAKSVGKALQGKKEPKLHQETTSVPITSTSLTAPQLRQRVIETCFVSPADARVLGFKGAKVTDVVTTPKTGHISLNTEASGNIKEAQLLFENIKKEMIQAHGSPTTSGEHLLKNGGKRFYTTFSDGTNIQLRSEGNSGHPKVEIKDVQKNIYEKITFKQEGK